MKSKAVSFHCPTPHLLTLIVCLCPDTNLPLHNELLWGLFALMGKMGKIIKGQHHEQYYS